MRFFRVWRHWILLAPGMRRSLVTAVVTSFLASAMLYQTNVRSERPPTFSKGGTFAAPKSGATSGGVEVNGEVARPSASPATSLLRSSATLSAQGNDPSRSTQEAVVPQLPAPGVYTYKVEGYEEATGFGQRDYPDTMTMTVHRPGGAELEDNEIVFDLFFSDDHQEREIVQYTTAGVSFTFEAGEITFGAFPPQTSEASYRPPMFQVPFPLDFDVKRTGTSEAVASDGTVTRTEDWTLEVLGRETLDVLNSSVDSWVTKIHRLTKPGSSESVDRTRQYWFDTGRMAWVKWTEEFRGEQDIGPGTFSYHTEFTATLIEIESL